ncbi:MAG: hypothetical protein AAFQ54_12030 [Pseudomonadota bacterium]
MSNAPDELRWVLREATRDDHARLDALVVGLDLGTEAGLLPFLTANARAYGALAGADAALDGHVARRHALLTADLAALGAPLAADHDAAAPDSGAMPSEAEALGYRYVVAGSALGGTVLARSHARGSDARVLAAGRFLGDVELMALWRAVIGELAAYDGPSAPVISGARRCFGIFERCFKTVFREELSLVR